jgi:hypothetical protein
MPDSKIVTIPIPSPISEDHEFTQIKEINDLLTNGYRLLRMDQSVRTDTKEVSLLVHLIKDDAHPAAIYLG